MNSRSPGTHRKKSHSSIFGSARDLLSGLLFLSAIWAFLSQIMRTLGILPDKMLTTDSSNKTIQTRLSGSKLIDQETAKKITANKMGPITQENPSTIPKEELRSGSHAMFTRTLQSSPENEQDQSTITHKF